MVGRYARGRTLTWREIHAFPAVLAFQEVGKAVGNVRNQGEGLIKPA